MSPPGRKAAKLLTGNPALPSSTISAGMIGALTANHHTPIVDDFYKICRGGRSINPLNNTSSLIVHQNFLNVLRPLSDAERRHFTAVFSDEISHPVWICLGIVTEGPAYGLVDKEFFTPEIVYENRFK